MDTIIGACRGLDRIMENRMDMKMENEMETIFQELGLRA